jgi:hypothetical protein
MTDIQRDPKEIFFNAMKELEQQHALCAARFDLVDSVLRGRESVTFAMIDRCREAVLQLRQAHHVFTAIHGAIADSPHAAENGARLRQMCEENDTTASAATAALTAILSWVPAAVNTRTGAVRID